MKKIVITGGSGFIGKNLLENISSKNYKIFCFLKKKNKTKKYSDNQKLVYLTIIY